MYMLTGGALGNQPKIEINAAQYAALKDALEIQGVALETVRRVHTREGSPISVARKYLRIN